MFYIDYKLYFNVKNENLQKLQTSNKSISHKLQIITGHACL